VRTQASARQKAVLREVDTRAEQKFAKFREEMSQARRNLGIAFAGTIVCSAIALKVPLFWLGSAFETFAFFGGLGGPWLNGRRHSPLKVGSGWLLAEAHDAAEDACKRDAASFDRYDRSVASIADLLLKQVTFADTEANVARRITTVFFLLGYKPLEVFGADRALLFTDGEERLLVRFRHRTGATTNATFVEQLVQSMRGARIGQGYLFCSPGLSGNAARLAEANGIRWYTLETMQEWIDDTLAGDYSGPPGDILEELDALDTFLGKFSYALPAASVGASRPRRRRWARW
jgi:hypothetical protein